MQKSKISIAAGFLIVMLAAAASYTIGPLEVGQPRRLAVETFPTTIGAWQAGPAENVDPEVQKRLATAHIMERVYINQQTGQAVDLMLLTATDSEDIHDPRVCFPSQGWELGPTQQIKLSGVAVNKFSASQGMDARTVLYWMTGNYPARRYANPVLRAAVGLRRQLMARNKNNSLFVRVMASRSADSNKALASFTTTVIPPLQALMQAGLSGEERKLIAPSQLWRDMSRLPKQSTDGTISAG